MKRLFTYISTLFLMATICFGQSQQIFDRPVSFNISSNIVNNATVIGAIYLNGTNLMLYLDQNFTKYSITNDLATTNYVDDIITNLATYAYVSNSVLPLATTNYVNNAVGPLATTTYVNNAVATLVSTQYVDTVVSNYDGIPSGCVLSFATSNTPTGWLECDGRSISRITYSNLFAVIGTSFGSTNLSTFFIPDLRGSFIRGWDNGTRGYDPDRASRTAQASGGNTGAKIGTVQDSAFISHRHQIKTGSGSDYGGLSLYDNQEDQGASIYTANSGGNETRPKNTYLLYCIKY